VNGIIGYVRRHHVGLMALLVALGGTAYAVDGPNPGQNTIGSEDIIGNEVKSDDIGNGRVFNIDLADDAIQSGKIKDATLLPADFASGTLPADASCPAGMARIAQTALCYETELREAAAPIQAMFNCGGANLSLPTPSEATSISLATNPGGSDRIWSDILYFSPGLNATVGVGVSASGATNGEVGPLPFRCTTYASDAGP